MQHSRARQLRRLARFAGHDPLKLYFVGIGGTGVSGLAAIARGLGHSAAGSDRAPSETTEALIERGVLVGFDQSGPALPADTELVVCSAAVPERHPELLRARELGIPVAKYAEALGAFVEARSAIAIAGTHGKTTTSSMAAYTLRAAALQPSFVIGGRIPQLGGSAAFGAGPDMVVEACEYDRSFLQLSPAAAVILNIEVDHFDCFSGLDDLLDTFVRFAHRIRRGGILIGNADCPNTARVLAAAAEARPDLEIVRFGFDEGADVRASGLVIEGGRPSFELIAFGESRGRVRLEVPGRHNAANALAALAAAASAGLSWEQGIEQIAGFQGVLRRFTLLRDEPGFAVVDDYAHHPTAIKAVVAAARGRFPGRRLIAVFEAHQHNRTRHLFADFRDALAGADRVLLADIYRCRDAETDVQAVDAATLAAAVRAHRPETAAEHAAGAAALIDRAHELRRSGDVFLFMGAGPIHSSARNFAAEAPSTKSLAMKRPRVGAVDAALSRALGPALRRDEPIARYLTFRAGGTARYYLEPRELGDFVEMVALLRRHGVPFQILGGGSNTLFADHSYRGAVIATRRLDRIDAIPGGLYTRCGALLQKVIHRLEGVGKSGLESLAGIPARMGGAIVMNCGGPPGGVDVARFVRRVLVLEADGKTRWIAGESAGFCYRGSELDGRIVLAAELGGFRADDPATIRQRRFEAARRKALVQPLAAASAGCIFRNPAGASAGRLIDEAGLKGVRCGGAEVSPRHANFIVNTGGATSADIVGLAAAVVDVIQQRTGHRLELELHIKKD